MTKEYKKRDFKEHVRRNILINPVTGCWLWQKAIQRINKKGRGGYGMVSYKQKWQTAHRAVYQEWVGPIPESRQVHHTCDVRHCVNPDHLWLGTQEQNLADAERKGRMKYWGHNYPPPGLGLKWYTDGVTARRLREDSIIPDGFRRGRPFRTRIKREQHAA